jgi:hypothetical protein
VRYQSDSHPSSTDYDPNAGPAWGSQGQLNGLAVVSLIFGLTMCLSLFGVIFGIQALRQIKRNGDRGHGFAISGIVLGSIYNGGAAILTMVSFAFGSGS